MMAWPKYKNKHLGEIGLIIGNGKSLRSVPRQLLEEYPSFGSNMIYLAYTEPKQASKNIAGFLPDYYCSVNPLVIEQCAAEIAAIPAEAKFIGMVPGFGAGLVSEIPEPSITQHKDARVVHGDLLLLRSSHIPAFSKRPDDYVYEGFTVTYVMLQLAYWMGFETVLLVGVDHNYSYTGQPNEANVDTRPKDNHFHPKYFEGMTWHNPDLQRSTLAYQMALTNYEADGRRIINLTKGSKLEVFEKGKYSDWIGGTQ
jgi:hypothetical protein